MKARRVIYSILGSLFILVNILVDITYAGKAPDPGEDHNIGFFIGSHFLIILGIIFLVMAINLNKKIKNLQGREIEKEINEMGTKE